MWTKIVLLVTGVAFMHRVISQDIYVSELMVENNVTLDAQRILLSWNASVTLNVTDSSGVSHTVTIFSSEVVAECIVVGEDFECNCTMGYVWSNEVCYNYNCCLPATCTANISLASSICVRETNVSINGSISPWNAIYTQTVQNSFSKLNGLKTLTVTPRSTATIADFLVNVSVNVNTSKLQEILTYLQSSVASSQIFVDTLGMVNIYAPPTPVKYQSLLLLNCTLEEATDSFGWNLTTLLQRFELNNGLIVRIGPPCATQDYQSCTSVTISNATGMYAGTYECGFTTGSVRHTARASVDIALLPDSINMNFSPLIADCLQLTPVTVSASIPITTEPYNITWNQNTKVMQTNPTKRDVFTYNFTASMGCTAASENIEIFFQNRLNQTKSANVNIPVLLVGASFCNAESIGDEVWPKTPIKTLVTNKTCPVGRVGNKTRYCNGSRLWEPVFSQCVSEVLNKVQDAATNFLNGLGATPEVAKNIFQGVNNNSNPNSGTGDEADIGATINIIGVMAQASGIMNLQEDVLPDLINAASNMVNSSWDGVNQTVRQSMSSNYLSSMENLVKNIQFNVSDGYNSTNLELKLCTSEDCSLSLFGVDVSLNKTNGTMKSLGVRNLMDKMTFDQNFSSILISATLVNNNDSNITIKMNFPVEQPGFTTFSCVFWNTVNNSWSTDGCLANLTGGNETLCECHHLTSFSVLMAKSANVSNPNLDMITYIGLGVSIFSLLLFLLIEYLVWSALIKTNLSHFRHTAVVNIAVFRLLGDCSFLASIFPEQLSETMCLTFTVCKHLFYVAMFTWMLCLSSMLVHQLIFVFSPLRKRVFMFFSSIVGYVVPILIVGSSYVYYKYTNKSYYDRKSCWLIYESLLKGSIHAFLLPVLTITLTNLFSMAVVILTLVKTSVPDGTKADEKETAKSILKVVVLLTPIFGVTWSLGFFLYTLNSTDPMFMVVNYLFTILNSFQGFFILVTGCLAEQKVRDELYKLIMAKTGRETDSMQKLTSTTYTKDK
uniref:Adhesion G-protein coupled receptor F3-like n=4 Tax=Nothobranchius TaxID=28779 RepID=A0A8C6LJM1_NOTFU